MSLFDIESPAPRPACTECGMGLGKRGETPGRPAPSHPPLHAIRVGDTTPCPGTDRPTS